MWIKKPSEKFLIYINNYWSLEWLEISTQVQATYFEFLFQKTSIVWKLFGAIPKAFSQHYLTEEHVTLRIFNLNHVYAAMGFWCYIEFPFKSTVQVLNYF